MRIDNESGLKKDLLGRLYPKNVEEYVVLEWTDDSIFFR